MNKVALEGLEFYAFHGHYDEEQKLGNKYAVDLEIEADMQDAIVSDKLKYAVDYMVVYDCVKEVMLKKHRLLEHIAHEIIARISERFEHIKSISVHVSKFNPPIGGVCHRAKVSIKKDFENSRKD
jgi:7,8-dihydroneopterin aldolase/epimerase/oxygenase